MDVIAVKSIGFTGTQRLSLVEKDRIIALRAWCREHLAEEYHHGDCIGADAFFHMNVYRRGKVIIHPPKNQTKEAFCGGFYEKKEPKDYLKRNHDIVNASDVLVALPANPTKEVLRSGTWATIRYARKQGIPVVLL